jgi:hypothetical protein
MKEVDFFETAGTYYPVTRRHIPDERNRQFHRCENLKTRTLNSSRNKQSEESQTPDELNVSNLRYSQSC